MSTLISYNGLQVVDPEPSATGGKAINDNFKALSTRVDTVDPGVNDDGTQGFSEGSRWFNQTSEVEFVCTSAATAAAVWVGVSESALASKANKVATAVAGHLATLTSAGDLADSGIAPSSLATTVALGNYLPLSGGTLTGQLTGTVAKFGTPTTAVASSDNVFATTGTSQIGVVIQTKPSATANALETQDSTGATVTQVMASGLIQTNSSAGYNGTFALNPCFVGKMNGTNYVAMGQGSNSYGQIWLGGSNAMTINASSGLSSTGFVAMKAYRLTFSGAGGPSTSGGNANFVSNGSVNSSTIAFSSLQVSDTVSPTSGSVTYVGLDIVSTINQTGSANGITRGVWVRPTITAAANFRFFQAGTPTTETTGTDNLIAVSAAGKRGLVIQHVASPSANAMEVQSSTGAAQFALGGDGTIRTNQASSATAAVGSLTNKLPIYDAAGTLLGYIPIYSSIS